MKPRVERMTVSKTWRLIRSDYFTMLNHYKKPHGLGTLVNFLLTPGFAAVVLFRLSHHFHSRGRKFVSRFFYLLNMALFGADITPSCRIDEGFVILHPSGIVMWANIGKNALLTCDVKIGGDGSAKDIGAGPGMPVLGDRVFMGVRSTVLGPNKIGDDAFICSNTFVFEDVPPEATMFGIPAKQIKNDARKILGVPKLATGPSEAAADTVGGRRAVPAGEV